MALADCHQPATLGTWLKLSKIDKERSRLTSCTSAQQLTETSQLNLALRIAIDDCFSVMATGDSGIT